MQSATTPDEYQPSWQNPRFLIWLFVIGAIIYNSITYANVAILGDFFGYFAYYVLATLWYNFAFKYSFSYDLNAEPDTSNLKTLTMMFINVFLSIGIFVLIMLSLNSVMRGAVIYVILILLTLAIIYTYYIKLQYEKNSDPSQMFMLYKSTFSTIFKFDYAALSILFPILMIHNKIITTNEEYDADVKNAKSQTVNNKNIPTPLGKQIVHGTALTILMLTLISYWWKFRTTVKLDDTINVSLDDRSSWFSLINIFPIGFLKAFPLFEYAKYVLNNDLVELAKKISITGLLIYIAYLMYSVYIQKKPLTPCTDSLFSTCFNNPFPIGHDIPYVNLLFWILIFCSIVNVVNWLIGFITSKVSPELLPSGGSAPEIITLIKLLLFPFYWFISLIINHPILTIVGFIAFAALGLLLYRSSFDLNDFLASQKGTVASLLIMFLVSLVAFVIYYMHSSTPNMVEGDTTYGQFILKTGMGGAVMICLIGLIMYFLNSHNKLVTVASVAQFVINAMIYIVGIAFAIGLGRTLFSTSRKMGGSIFQVTRDPESNWVINMLKLFANFLFYLPCLMLDFVDMIKEQYKLTTRPILILLAIEAAFILIGRFMPSMVAKVINHTGTQILSEPISLTTSVPITTYDIQFISSHNAAVVPVGSNSTMVHLKNYSYGMSAWFYIHPQPPNTNANYSDGYINILRFGDFGPSMQFSPKTNTLKFNLYGKPIKLKDDEPVVVSDVPLQTWNNVVINSDKGTVDIFINNKLVYTGNNMPDDKNNAHAAVFNVELGQTDGVHGEICNIVLNAEPFTKPEMIWLYKTNKSLNPPVVGIDMDPDNEGDSASYLAAKSVDKNAPKPTPMPSVSTSGAKLYGILFAVLGAIFGWLFNDENTMESAKGLAMGAIVFGLIGASLGATFSTDGTVAYILKTVANVFVDTF